MADRIFTSGAEAAEAAHFPPVSKTRCSWCGKHQDQLWNGINDNGYCDTCIHAMAGVHTSKPKQSPYIGWEYEEVRFHSISELQAYGKRGWEFFHIEAQAGGYRKALGKRLCST